MSRDITVFFDDGSSHVYSNAPDEITPDQVTSRAQSDFPGKQVRHMDGGRGSTVDTGLAEPKQEPTSNPFKGFAARGAELGANLLEATGRVAESIGDVVGEAVPALDRKLVVDKEGIRLTEPPTQEEREKKRQLDNSDLLPLFKWADNLREWGKGIDYQPSVGSVKELKENPVKTIPFIVERLISSAPDMVAAAGIPEAYLVSLTNETLNERLKNDNKKLEDATITDISAAVSGAVVQTYLEKFATGRLLKPGAVEGASTAGRIAKEAGLQAGTEAVEETGGYAAESVGTKKGFDPETAALIAAEAAIVGGGLGAGVKGTQEYLQKRAERAQAETFKAATDKAQARLQEIEANPQATEEEKAEAEFIKNNLGNPAELVTRYAPQPATKTTTTTDETEAAPPPPAPPAEIKSASDLINAPPKVAAEDAPDAVRNEPVGLDDDAVYEEIDKMEQLREQLAELLFDPAQLQTQASLAKTSVEDITTRVQQQYDELATRLDVFDKNYMARMQTSTPMPTAIPGAEPVRTFTPQELAAANISPDLVKALNLRVQETPPAQPNIPATQTTAKVPRGAEPLSPSIAQQTERQPVGGGIELPPQGQPPAGRVAPQVEAAGLEPTAGVASDVDAGKAVGQPALNADRRPISTAVNGVKSFWNWFKNSITKDNFNRPKVYYHGSQSGRIEAFSLRKARNTKAFFVSPSPSFAADFSGVNSFEQDIARNLEALNAAYASYDGTSVEQPKTVAPTVYPVYVRAENPFDYQNPEHVRRVAEALAADNYELDVKDIEKNLATGSWEDIEDRPTQEVIKNLGFDGFFVQEMGVKNLAVYDPNQIKSAVGNVGTFSTESDKILAQKAPLTEEQKAKLADRIVQRLSVQGRISERVGPFGTEKTVVSKGFNPRFASFVKSIVGKIGLGDAGILVVTKKDLQGRALNDTLIKYNLDSIGYDPSRLVNELINSETVIAQGGVYQFPNGKGYIIFLDDSVSVNQLLENLGHELGHIVEHAVYKNADSATKSAISREYEAWLKKNNKVRSLEIFKRARAKATAEWAAGQFDKDYILDEDFVEYLTSFQEWFADNVAKWMTTSEKPLTLVEKFFSALGKRLRKLAAELIGTKPEYLPAESVAQFLEGLTPPDIRDQAVDYKGKPRPIFPSIRGIKNFWSWFGDSKVVDSEGRPIIMYHGSPKIFSVFRPGRAKAIFFSTDPYFASTFTLDAYDYDVGPVYAVYVKAENPFDYENPVHVEALIKKANLSMADGQSVKEGDWRIVERPDIQKAIKALGHDGFYVFENVYSPVQMDRVEAKNLAVYDPSQVKSALGNNGSFSKKDRKINASGIPFRNTVNNVGAAVSNLPKLTQNVYATVRGILGSRIPDSLRSGIYAFMSLPQQVELFAKELPTLRQLLNVLNVRASALKERREVLDRNVRKWNTAIKDNIKYKDEFYEIAHESTRLQIEFNNPDPKFANHPLTQRFNRLPPELQKVYWEMLASYRNMADEYLKLVSKNLSPSQVKKLQREMAKKRLRVYLPLYREGDYWMRYQDAQNETVVQSFKSNYERDLAWKEAVANGAISTSKQNFNRIEDLFKDKGPGTFFNRIMEELNKRGASPATKRALYELYLDQIPASSVRQQYRKRDGYKGYESDLMNVYATVASRMANQLTNLEYIPEIDRVYDEVKQEADVYSASGQAENLAVKSLVEDNLRKQMDYLRDPGNGSLVNALSSFSYYWYIIGNVSTALVNTTQLPMVVLPMLSGKYNFDKAAAAMAEANKIYFNGGWDNDNIPGGVKKFPSDYSFGVGLSPNSPLAKLYRAAVRQSAIRRSTGYDLVEGRKKTYGMGDYIGLMAKTEQIMGWVFQNSERYNREITLIAAFNLELEKNGGNIDEAIKTAIDLVNQTHGTTLAETSPRMFQTGFGKVAFTFKNFAQTQIYLVSKLLRDAVKGESPEIKKLAAKQLIGIMAMTWAFAGLHGMPFYGAATLLADLTKDLWGDDDDPTKADEIVRRATNELAWKGPVNQLLMADVASRTGFNGLLWRDDDKRLEEVGPVLFAIEQLLGPSYAAFMGVGRGIKDYKEGHYDRAIEAFTPSFIRNGLKTYRYTVEGAKTRDGEKIYDDFDAYQLFLQVMGFTPTDISERAELSKAFATQKADLTERRTALLDRLYLARINKDREGIREAREAIKKFNNNPIVKKYRSTIGFDDIEKSYNTRRRNARNSVYGVTVPKESQAAYKKEYKKEEDR